MYEGDEEEEVQGVDVKELRGERKTVGVTTVSDRKNSNPGVVVWVFPDHGFTLGFPDHVRPDVI